MTSIKDYSDDPRYTIKAVSAQTGIRTVTLRAWERRYDILSPYRLQNRYRLYSERDIAILRWIKIRLERGLSISSIAVELHNLVKNEVWPEVVPAATPAAHTKTNLLPADYSQRLYNALIHHDEVNAAGIYDEMSGVFDLPVVISQVLTPVLVEIGEAWFSGGIRITTEHYASGFLRGKLLSLLQGFSSQPGTPLIMTGCAPTEQHEIGSLMLAVLLRAAGYRVEYLGPDIPLEDLSEYARLERPDMIILAASMPEPAELLKKMAELLPADRTAPIFAYGGAAFRSESGLRTQISGIYLGDTLLDAVSNVRSILPLVKKKTHSRSFLQTDLTGGLP